MSADSPAEDEPSDAEALQNALRAEHAAVYGYGFIGAHCEGEDRERSRECLDAHRTKRDALRSALVRLNVSPAASKAAYALPDSTDRDTLGTFAAELEERTTHGYLRLAAASDTSLRDLAARALQEATIRGLRWGAELVDLPGFPDGTGAPGGEDVAGD
ncbi:ferritin-like domain-containing protein [Halostreptopolyspora alba]|uniref:DUF4439 domain-containing protein n=1 Tax=Halostreptopolyspora alba TaxID=2487137 RepID=A0A3N0E4E7_9ACTN|nr:DUF4439 domain-containing protein [Nocardiopsaceae bacterium YIM 96095]